MVHILNQDDKYTYEIFQEKDSIECANLLAHTFTKHNPYEIAMKTTYERFYMEAISLCKVVVNMNLSVIARCKQTNEIHSIIQAVDVKVLADQENSESNGDNSAIPVDPFLDLLHELEQRYLVEYEKKYGKLTEKSICHIFMAGVRTDCIGQGLGTKLHQVLFENVRCQGFKHIVVDVINPSMLHIYMKKFNGKMFTSIYAPTWIAKNENGEDYRPFEHFKENIPLIVFDL